MGSLVVVPVSGQGRNMRIGLTFDEFVELRVKPPAGTDAVFVQAAGPVTRTSDQTSFFPASSAETTGPPRFQPL